MSSCDLPVLPAVLMLIACRLACCACWAHSGDVVLSGRLFVCIIRTKVAHYDWKRHNECLSYRSCRRDQVSANGCYTDITESCVASLPLTERKVRGQYMTPAAIGDMMAARLFNPFLTHTYYFLAIATNLTYTYYFLVLLLNLTYMSDG